MSEGDNLAADLATVGYLRATSGAQTKQASHFWGHSLQRVPLQCANCTSPISGSLDPKVGPHYRARASYLFNLAPSFRPLGSLCIGAGRAGEKKLQMSQMRRQLPADGWQTATTGGPATAGGKCILARRQVGKHAHIRAWSLVESLAGRRTGELARRAHWPASSVPGPRPVAMKLINFAARSRTNGANK